MVKFQSGVSLPSGFIKHGWLENPLGMKVLIGTSLINGPFSIAMFDYRLQEGTME